jgi:hypothetical protein
VKATATPVVAFLFLMATISGLPQLVTPSSQWVTNWVSPSSNHRLLNNRFYDVNSSPYWATLVLPAGTPVSLGVTNVNGFETRRDGSFRGYRGRIERINISLTLPSSTPPTRIVVRNYPYDPKLFMEDSFHAGVRLKQAVSYRLFPLSVTTNYTRTGNIVSIDKEYDWGLQYTNPVPVVQRIKHKGS